MHAGNSHSVLDSETEAAQSSRDVRRLVLLGLTSWALYAAIAQLSTSFAYGAPRVERPIPLLLLLLMVLFAIYLLALRTAVRCPRGWLVILSFAIAFRILLLFTQPILEIDIYRYMWDGEVVAAGVSPYRYAPAEVKAATHPDSRAPFLPGDDREGGEGERRESDDLNRLIALCEGDAAVAEVLSRIHYPELTTVYPPVSQVVFASAALSVRSEAGVMTRLVVMKAWVIVFDLLTLLVMARLLRDVGWPVGWSLAWGWCPLVIKEFANSGHLDAIAVCLTLMAVWFAVRGLFGVIPSRKSTKKWVLAASFVLAMATGAKLYPVVLAPLLLVTMTRRHGWRTAGIGGLLYTGVSCLVLFPMLVAAPSAPQHTPLTRESGVYVDLPPPTPPAVDLSNEPIPREPRQGLQVFLSRWKMNDFLFLILEANLHPLEFNANSEPWFSVVPFSWRKAVIDPIARKTGLDSSAATFALTRAATATIFAMLALYWAWTASAAPDPVKWLSAAFLTLAWFWLLSPTQNPWYWTWALPLVPFARCRAWLAMSGLVMLYYLRFWLVAHWPDVPVAGTRYTGAEFFNYVVIWLEYCPWFATLTVEANCRIRQRGTLSEPECLRELN